ncbi:LuxR family transcriptional regulator [Streptomyces bungoensis]|uniref:LuxR family transcriptional regulator n=1 Tax=Streptomyces bungoensis TaxID=285568 RepID=A0A101SS93_9ACTN|nr:LuxR family transcriptional regulator [Streptomyces bungoensis]KUN79028.1 LuxR family transcriptional regulator [Streptomyces bungoensis]
MEPHPIVGRDTELGELSRLVASSHGQAVLVRGEAGMGKSLLLAAAADQAGALGHRVIRVTGVESEMALPFAGLHQILHPLLHTMSGLDQTTQAVLDTVFGRRTGQAPSVMALGIAVLDVLALASGEVPLLLIVDDGHWFDPQSAEVGGFIARRLAGHAVRMITAVRADTPSAWDSAAVPELSLAQLGPESSADLLRMRAPGMPPAVRTRVLELAQGNPLALTELPQAVEQGTAGRMTADELPLPRRLEHMYGDRIRNLPAAERTRLLLAALDGGGAGTPTAGRPRYRLQQAEEAVARGLLVLDAASGELLFRHPLVRSALLQTATPNERRAAHARLAELHRADLERHATHLAAATVDPDETVAAVLERAARSASARGGATAAVALLTRAAELSPAAGPRSRRLGDAAFVAAQSALLDTADELRQASDRLAAGTPSPAAVVTAAYTALYQHGDVRSAHRRVVHALRTMPSDTGTRTGTDTGTDSQSAVRTRLLNLLLAISLFSADPALWSVSDGLVDAQGRGADETTLLYRDVWGDITRRGHGARERLQELFARLDEEQPWDVMRLSVAAYYLDALGDYRFLVRQVAEREVGSGAVTNAMTMLQVVMLDQITGGDWDAAERTGQRGLELSTRHGYTLFEHQYHGFLGLIAAWRGDAARAREAMNRLDRWARPRGVGYLTQLAEAIGAATGLTEGDYESAYAYAGGLTAPGTFTPYSQQAPRTLLDLVEAAVHTGRGAQARAHTDAARKQGLPAISPRLDFLTAAAEAMTAEGEAARAAFERATRHPAAADHPFELARVRLAQGMWLRRARERAAARTVLVQAADAFERLGAAPWARRVQAELRATGAPGGGPAPGQAALTAQERRIAELAAGGLSNREIGAQLFLSPRTVGAHLYRVFPKLGITSRAALRDALTGTADAEPEE